jgi:hypothetical protein
MPETKESAESKPWLVFEPVLHPPTGQPIKHFPGPYRAEGPDMFGDWNIIPAGDCGAVAAVVSNMRPPEVVEGNAHLLAAAPDLLAALRTYATELCEHSPHSEVCGKLDDDQCFGCRARRAIAKAEGRA